MVVVPARWGSRRLPGKPLADLHGLPMVEHVRRRVLQARSIDRVLIATDDQRIFDVVQGYGGEVVMTGEHPNGTHRAYAAVTQTGDLPEVVVNVQGDMPLVDPHHVDHLVDLLLGAEEGIATLAAPLDADPNDPNHVKVVTDRNGRALYFSRAPIPWHGPYWRHLGLYAFSGIALLRAHHLPPGPLDVSEDLEQLRWLEAGLGIRVGRVTHAEPGVDTPEQLEALRTILADHRF